MAEFEEELYKYITGIIKNLDQQLIRINGMPDHCHLLVRLRPSLAPSKFIQVVKTNSSRWINEKNFPIIDLTGKSVVGYFQSATEMYLN
jgi:REP element-mobilizing transposase RayT